MAHTPVCVGGLTPYEVLGLNPGASADEVRSAVRQLAKVLHPDVAPHKTSLFLIVQAAAECASAGGKWQASAPASDRSKPKPMHSPAWRMSKKGNWYRKVNSSEIVTVYLRDETWWWVGPDFDGGSEFSSDAWDTPAEAMADAEDYFFGGD